MFRNYLKTAWRSIFKNKTFSFINIMGLALGMACSLLIMLWVHDERSVDAFHQNDEQLYRVYTRHFHDGVIDGGHYGPGLLASELKVVYPEVKFATMMAWSELNTFEGNNKILKKSGDYGSPDFFSVFSYPLVEGTPETALKDPVDIAISRKMAEDFFGSAHAAMGQTLRFQNSKDLKVSAVFENITSQSSKTFEYLVNWETFLENNQWAREWGNNGPQTTIVLQPGTDVAAFEAKAKDFLDAHNDNKNYVVKLALQKHSESYLHSEIKGGEIVGGRIQYVVLFTITSVLILLIACVNFMNLTTARSIKRAKEIGVRKVVGAVRSALIRQFIGEALLIVVLAVTLSLIIVALALPAFNSLTQKQIVLPIMEPVFWAAIAGLTAITGLLSGSYPALYLSAFNPVRAFKGALKFSSGALWFRKGLVVFQFTLSLMLIIGTIVISRQVGYIQSVHLGYDRENLIYIPLEGELTAKYHTFKQQALAQSGIKMISRISQSPTSISNGTGGVKWDGKDPNSMVQFSHAAIGLEFTRTMNIQLVDGRDFGIEFPSDSSAYLLNEAAVKLIGFTDPVGMPLTFWDRPGKVVGVIKDFHFQSLHTNIEPLVLRLGEDLQWGWALVRVEPGKTKESLASLEKICKELNPQFPFTYEFSDEEYQKLYKSEQTVEVLSNIFAGLAIFISCLGLLGLSMFTAEQRTKEIGIRKVLGAGVFSLFNLLSRDLFLLVAVSLLIASPIAWYFMNDWLKAFAYKVNVGWWIFVVAGCLAILIALATVSVHTLKAIFTNPVKSLRSE